MQNSMTPYQPGSNLDSTTALLIGMKQKGTLQSYVAAHRGTPEYPTLLALATSINNVSAASEAAKYQPPAQTVADQHLASLAPVQPAAPQALPENQGIGQLPAPNLETVGKAAGGIIAFNDGGEVPRFNGQYGSVPQALPGGLGIYSQGSFGPQAGAVENQTWAQRKMDEIAAKVRAGTATTQERAWISAFGGDAMQRVGARETQAMYQNAPDTLGGEAARLKAFEKPVVAKPTVDTAAEDKTVKTDSGIDKLLDKTPRASAPSTKGYEDRLGDIVYKNAPKKDAYMQEAAEIDKPVIEKVQATIDAQKSKLKSENEQNFFMSMIIGGLEAAGGDSQYALQNIAKGGAKGAAHFNEGIKDLRKAAQENAKMEVELAKYEATGKKEALKSYYAAQERRDDRYADGMTRIMTQQMQTQGQIAAAGAGARAGVDAQIAMLERLGSAKEGSPLLTGLERKTQEDKIPRLYADYTKLASDPMKGEEFLRKYPTFEVYRAGMGGSGSGQFVTLPNTTVPSAVRSRPN